MALSEGELLSNRYKIITLVGRGGMADVYKVWDQQRATHLAIKVLHEDIAMDRVFIRRFQREGQVLERLQHPNIVRFYGLEHEQAKRLVFLLMDLIEGRSLKHEIFDRNGPMPLSRVMELLRPICAALFYAHNQGVVHADVKPGNILINNLGQVFTSDFGIARLSESATVTLVGAGTPPYMAPEQFKGSITPLSDQYSLGIMLFELLTGERPFTGETARTTGSTQEKIFWEHLHAKPPSPRRWNRDISPEIDRIVLRCLEKKPEDRFPSVLDLLTQLEAAAAPRPVIPALPKALDETVIPKAPQQKPVKPVPQPVAPVIARPTKAIGEIALKGPVPVKGIEIPTPAVQPLPIITKPEEAKKEPPTAPPAIPAPTPIPQEVILEKPAPAQVEPVLKKAAKPKPVRRRAWAFPLIAILGLAVLITPLFIPSIFGSRTPNTTLPATALPETPFIPTMMDTTAPAIVSSITSTLAPSATNTPTRTESNTPTPTVTSTPTNTATNTPPVRSGPGFDVIFVVDVSQNVNKQLAYNISTTYLDRMNEIMVSFIENMDASDKVGFHVVTADNPNYKVIPMTADAENLKSQILPGIIADLRKQTQVGSPSDVVEGALNALNQFSTVSSTNIQSVMVVITTKFPQWDTDQNLKNLVDQAKERHVIINTVLVNKQVSELGPPPKVGESGQTMINLRAPLQILAAQTGGVDFWGPALTESLWQSFINNFNEWFVNKQNQMGSL